MKILRNDLEKGFTLVEIMVVMSLIIVFSSIFLGSGYRQNQIRNSLLTDSVDLATTIQDMQSRASTFVLGDANIDNVGYGVFLNSSDPNKIESFYKLEGQFSISDLSNSSISKPEQDIILNYGTKIGKICLNGCSTFSSDSTKLAVFFVKPKSYANFSVLSSNGVTYTTTVLDSGVEKPISRACLELVPASGTEYRHIDIYRVGQITAAYGQCQ
jgi:prepilin-type N-terminal cleavage/methylation domain-containing protein